MNRSSISGAATIRPSRGRSAGRARARSAGERARAPGGGRRPPERPRGPRRRPHGDARRRPLAPRRERSLVRAPRTARTRKRRRRGRRVVPGLEPALQRAEVRNASGVVARRDGRRCDHGRRSRWRAPRRDGGRRWHTTPGRRRRPVEPSPPRRAAQKTRASPAGAVDLANEHRLERIDGARRLHRARAVSTVVRSTECRPPPTTDAIALPSSSSQEIVSPAGLSSPRRNSDTLTPPVHVRPEQALHLAARRQRHQQRAVAQHRGREVLQIGGPVASGRAPAGRRPPP